MADESASRSESIPVVSPSGKVGYLPKEFAKDAAAAGVRKASDAEIRAAQVEANQAAREKALQDKYDNSGLLKAIEGTLAPAAAGAARGLSVGLSDQLAVGTGRLVGGEEGGAAVADRLKEYRDYAPVTSTVSELGAIVGASMLGNEAALGTIPRAISGLGSAAERGAMAVAGTGALGRIAGGMARGGAEMAIYGAGKAASDAALENEDLSAEKFVAGAGHGLILGAGGGAVLSGLGVGLGAIAKKVGGLRAPAGAVQATEAGAAKTEQGVGQRLGTALQDSADAHVIKSLGGSKGDIMALERNVEGGFRKVARDVKGYLDDNLGKLAPSREEIHVAVTEGAEAQGKKIGQLLKQLDESKTGIAPSVESFEKAVSEKVLSKMYVQTEAGAVAAPFRAKEIKAVNKVLEQVRSAFGKDGATPTFEGWQRARVALDKEINFAAAKVSPAADALRKMRGLMESELESAAGRAAEQTGGKFLAEYQAAKSLYQSLTAAAKLSERGVAGEVANNAFGLTSRMAGIAGSAFGAVSHGLGGGLLTGAAGSLAGKVIQDRGDMLAANLLERGAAVLGVRRVASKVEGQIADGVTGLVGRTSTKPLGAPAVSNASPLGIPATGSPRKDFEKLDSEIRKLQSNPAAAAERVSQSVASLADHAPKTAQAVVTTSLRGLEYLASKLPDTRKDPYSLQPMLETKTRASDAEIGKFLRVARAVDSPLVILREAKNGTLTRDEVDAVKSVYPQLYEEIRAEVFRSLVSSKSELPYSRRIQLGILLDIPTDKTLAPEFLQALQATYSSAEKAGAESPPPTLSRPIQIATSLQTANEAAMQEGLER